MSTIYLHHCIHCDKDWQGISERPVRCVECGSKCWDREKKQVGPKVGYHQIHPNLEHAKKIAIEGQKKECSDCGEIKSLSEFYNRPHGAGLFGKMSRCKICHAIRTTKWRKNHPDIQHKAEKNFRKAHRHNRWANSTISKHRDNGYEVNIKPKDLEEIAKKTSECSLCKIPLGWNNEKILPNTPTLDRINNEHEMNLTNVMIICHRCNSAKGDKTMKQFVNYCKEIVKEWGDKV
jgi:5-methylcytosine-specific restriction endonuclease McrA